MMKRVGAVVVVSDGVAAGDRVDESGELARDMLRELGFECPPTVVVPDDVERIVAALRDLCSARSDLILTTGGTGFGLRDVTPEATARVIDRPAPGMVEAIRSRSPGHFGMLSRAIAGMSGTTIIVNTPGSKGGVRDAVTTIGPVLEHMIALSRGESIQHPNTHDA